MVTSLSALEWSIRVKLKFLFRLYIFKFKIILKAVRAFDHKLGVSFCLLSHVTDAKTAKIVLTTARSENGIEITKAYRTAILVFHLFLSDKWIVVLVFNITLAYTSLDSYLIPVSNLIKSTLDRLRWLCSQ